MRKKNACEKYVHVELLHQTDPRAVKILRENYE